MRALLLLLVLLLPAPALAGMEVVASIAPVHSLVARVMQGTGQLHLLLPPGTSPHDHALRPSDAAALDGAAMVVWIGPGIEPWLERPLATLARATARLRLDAVPGLTLLPAREDAAFEAHAHDPATSHTEGQTAPHLWLNPENAKLWLDAIAAALAGADPANARRYRANAAAARAELDILMAEIDRRLAPFRGRPFILYHDAFQYFERRFAIPAAGAVALSDARVPGPARVAAIRARIRAIGALCLFGEPQVRPRLLGTVTEGSEIRIGSLDPLGAGLEPGPSLYPALIQQAAASLEDCLGR